MSYSDTNLSNTATRHHRIQRFERSESHRSTLQDVLADEAPVAIQYNGINHVVMLASAIDLIDLAYGFSYTEGIIRQPSDIYDCQIHPASNGLILDITIASACLQQLKLKRRRMTGQTGCGLCGIESLAALEHDFNPLPQGVVALSTEAIDKALNQLQKKQPLKTLTGATHAAGWADLNGNILSVREDVGRHNALDKLIGHLLRENTYRQHGFAVVSSRASFEMVQKTITAQIPALIAVSAPTSMAVKTAQNHHLILVGFTHKDKFNIYSEKEQIYTKNKEQVAD